MHRRVLCNATGFYSLDANCTTPAVTTNLPPDIAKCHLRTKLPLVENSGVLELSPFIM